VQSAPPRAWIFAALWCRRRSGSSARSRPGTARWTSVPGNWARRSRLVVRSSSNRRTRRMVAQCFADAGLPAGVLNDLPGTGPEAGAALAAHPDVRMITATASTSAGQSMMRAAAETMKRLTLELGGHCPFVVLGDADIGEAASAAARRSFSNMGQICIAVNRILVADAVHDESVDALAAETRRIKLGHAIEPGVAYGPVLHEGVRARTRSHVEDALRRGGTLIDGAAATGLCPPTMNPRPRGLCTLNLGFCAHVFISASRFGFLPRSSSGLLLSVAMLVRFPFSLGGQARRRSEPASSGR
jgi:acyl-CoA reductase-like NAD-dependent aldehyde dehydrogenase